MTSNTRNHASEPAGKGPIGSAAYGGSSSSGKAPFRHIDDIVSVSVDLDPHATLRKVLDAGDAHMRQAITFRDFGRPDLALQEYIKAFTIAVDKVPKHKDYPSLKSDRGDLSRLYHALKVKITNNGVAYESIKKAIKEDNLRSGVQPKKHVIKSSENILLDLPSVPSSPPSQNSIDSHDTVSSRIESNSVNTSTNDHSTHTDPHSYNGSSPGRKARPVVHPKPQALHGKSIKPVPGNASPDLVARFAKLRGPQESRNNTSPLPLAKPTGPRAMPPHRFPLSVDSSLPSMPKVPDAIYSPARGTVTSEAANLPSSTPRGMFSRTNSVISAPSTSSRTSMESIFRTFNGEQFATAHTYGDSQASTTNSSHISEGEFITVAELLRFMKEASAGANTRLLIIDVRDRQLFDEGHIFSQNTICLDPTILSRQNISASEIVDSMILAPTNEKLALERRDEFDLIVFYDQDSKSIPPKITSNINEMVLFNLRQALVHYSFEQLASAPKLLVGGLNAWVDEMGKQSLQTSKTQQIPGSATLASVLTRQRLRNRTLKPEEVDTFEAMIGRDENGEFDYAKSQEDFMRRFPSIREPESMISDEKDDFSAQSTSSGGEDFLKDMTPMPPVRPKPSVARTRYSGLESADEQLPSSGLAMIATAANAPGKPTGLMNPGNWCYANASLQALLASQEFVREFLDAQWPIKYRPDVSSLDPAFNQLLCRIIGNLFQWLSQRSIPIMKAETLMHYLRTIHHGYRVPDGSILRFGDSNQHDSDEFITFLFGQLEIETRIKWAMNNTLQLDTTQPAGYVADQWRKRVNNSIISRYWYLLELQTYTCNNCKVRNFVCSEAERLAVPVPAHNNGGVENALRTHYAEEQRDSECDKCKARSKTFRNQIVRLPPLLRVQLQRTNQTSTKKHLSHFRFPFDELNLRPYALDSQTRREIAKTLGGDAAEGFDCQPRYVLFAVVAHSGERLNSGHYTCHIKADNGTWTFLNDSLVTTGHEETELQKTLQTCQTGLTPVQLFYRRQEKGDKK
ncbi:hypothetical protein GQX73_g772 [Xylaria multiplex]|uniref:USP domain-containing protein n=1 Tax=Xylaria multiplex TaxID=323545 RepID=A0A7C8N069_9PEZI|nr:hypothetical protein GQX73_g772 [Xylaria multiplex]